MFSCLQSCIHSSCSMNTSLCTHFALTTYYIPHYNYYVHVTAGSHDLRLLYQKVKHKIWRYISPLDCQIWTSSAGLCSCVCVLFFWLTQGLSFHIVSLNSIPDSNLNIVESVALIQVISIACSNWSRITLVEILYRILQDFLGSYKILQDPVRSHRIKPKILNGNNPNHVF